MRNVLKTSLVLLSVLTLASCSKSTSGKSTLTGLPFNNPKYGNYIRGNETAGQEIPLGMVAIEGGSFTMGQVQDDVMFDWNTTPKKMHIRSFYMDETEVTNSEYFLYIQNIKDVFPPSEEKYKHIYNSVLPDTLVWRKSLGNTDILSENYLRHPAYSDYPVVGVSWLQANQYCKWRTNAVNLKKLIDKGYIKNIFENDSIRNFFDTDVFLADSDNLFDGDTTVYKRGIRSRGPIKNNKGSFQGRKITQADGVLSQKYRLPTEAEWEFAAKANIENREYNNIRGRKKYAWNGKYSRETKKRHRGDQMANFKQGEGNYSGLSGWSTDGSDIPIIVKSYPPNAFGLYDMSGNVAEWVADVYRPIIDNEANDFNYFRGNIFTKKMIDKDGKVVIVNSSSAAEVEYDTLPNGVITPKQFPGTIKYIPITKDDATLRRNFSVSDNTDIGDGDLNSSRFYEEEEDQFGSKPSMYNSPRNPTKEIDPETGREILVNDAKKRTTLISNRTRVYKGGAWSDGEYWLDPAQRRYLPEYMATNFIGFRCVTDKVGPMSSKKKKARNSVR
ncbi:gliding motility lipoprotein GldJ [Polaribacter sp. Z014]|uniref:gliding motility lipoprotein GldJ n=1 Tax=unclassified Polaribacter TaxID=196858 RepID=UPI00193C66DD|nr:MULTISPECIES: gliding motility lipoprotein GldJ [unclassified Polaribacter]MCL7763368.1 gliding motility lipoprotein GldJ [Polaribacter sp. Z014]QVY67314.1 gliding motility lipoprotein GldJ [Polaribacter sp. Q13]